MHRRLPALPLARSAVWCPRFAVLGAAISLVAVGAPRHGNWSALDAVLLLAMGLLVAAVAFPCAVAAAIVIWRYGWKGIGRTVVGLALSSATLAYPAYLAASTVANRPPLDVSTDRDDPPVFAVF